MHEILRNRLLRKLEVLPEEQLYQVLDYIEFLESKYAPGRAVEPGGIQRFAERLEDRLRARSVVPQVMTGTMKVVGVAGRMLDGLSDAGRGIVAGIEGGLAAPEGRADPAGPPGAKPARAEGRPEERDEPPPQGDLDGGGRGSGQAS